MSGFTDEERERIREQLIETGHELLLRYGPKKTTVADITDPVGIAKPTFYQFFDAKSDLYLVILQRELEEYMENVRSELLGVEDPQEGLERFFRCYVEFGEGNPFIQQMLIQGNYQEILRNVSSEQLAELQRQELAEFIPIIEDLKSRSDGPIVEMDPFTVLGIMGGSVGLLILHKDEFEEYDQELEEYDKEYEQVFDSVDSTRPDGVDDGYYKHIQNALIETLARGLTT